jgi:integrase
MNPKDKIVIPAKKVRSLPVKLWPAADRIAWVEACRPSIRLKRGGAASHLKPVVQHDLAKRYGLFLDSVIRSGQLDVDAAAGAQVTPNNVTAYVSELKCRVSSVTVYGSIQKLRRMVQLVAPKRDVDWLVEIEREIYSERRPRPKWDRVADTGVLADAGLTLMMEAEMTKRPALTRARLFRNGLMIAILAYCPNRLKNFTALEIGRSFVNVDGTWWIVLTAAETKEKREDERPLAEELSPWIERYLEVHRPVLGREKHVGGNALWLAMNGKAMSAASIGEIIPETTRIAVGVSISPHLFRTAGVTTLATHVPGQPHAGSALLHHRPGPVTQENYNRASCITAGKSLAAVNRGYRHR